MGESMNLLNKKIKFILGLIGIATNVSAHAQKSPHQAVLSHERNLEVNQFENQGVQAEIPQFFQTVSEDELINALQNNSLDQLLLKKGILIKKPSADSTVCEKCTTGN